MTPSLTETQTPRYAVIFTTYEWDGFVEAQYRRNVARVHSGDMHVIADEGRGAVPVPTSYSKTTASEAAAKTLGLRIAYHRTLFWHNIDYLYYIFYDRFPVYDYYIFLDYDTVVGRDVDSLVGELSRRRIDYVGAPIQGTIEDWVYAADHAAIYDRATLEGRISAVTVLSNRALAHLFHRRRQDSASPSRQQQKFWPFCEAFVPIELKRAGFVSAELSEFGNTDQFAWWPPTLDETLAAPVSDSFVHPVLDRPRYIGSLVRHSKTLDFLLPWSRLWRAVASCPDRRWVKPLLAEARRRLDRVVLRRSVPTWVETVGMRGFDKNAAPRKPAVQTPAASRRMAGADRRS